MKTNLKYFFATFGLLVPLLLRAQQTPFDVCAYPTNMSPDKKIYFGGEHKTVTVDVIDGTDTNNNYSDKLETYYVGTIGNIKVTEHLHSSWQNECADLFGYFDYKCGCYYPDWSDATAVFMAAHSWAPPSLSYTINNYMTNGTPPSNASEISERHDAKSYDVSATFTNDPITTSYSVESELVDPFIVSSDINDGTDPCPTNCPDGKANTSTQSPSNDNNPTVTKNDDSDDDLDGMPQWFISEPYLNLWIQDQPVFYTTSLGKKIDFKIAYKQHDTRPTNSTVPPTGWGHNWFSYVHFVVPTYLSSTNSGGPGLPMPGFTGPVSINPGWVFTNDFSQWQAILYGTDSGENYFDHATKTEGRSGLQLIPADGVDAHIYPLGTNNPAGASGVGGFKLVHPDGSVDVYDVVSSPQFSFGIVHNEGRIYDIRNNSPRLFNLGATAYYDTTNGNYVADQSQETAIGQQVGYVACDALLTQRIDPYGNIIGLSYSFTNGTYQLKTIVDYDAKTTTLSYDASGLLTNVAMPYGRSASFVYSGGQMTGITDAQGMSSSFSYTSFPYTRYPGGRSPEAQTNIYVSSMTTLYGTTLFDHYEASPYVAVSNPPSVEIESPFGGGTITVTNWHGTSMLYVGWFGGTNRVNKACTVTHPDGTHELYLYRYDSRELVPSSYPTGEALNTDLGGFDDASSPDADSGINHLLSMRNSFHWNRQQYPLLSTTNIQNLTTNDFRLATLKHWLQNDTPQSIYPHRPENNVSSQMSLLRDASPDGVQEGAKTWLRYDNQSYWLESGDAFSSVTAATVLSGGDVQYHQIINNDGLLQSVTDTYTTPTGDRGTRSTSCEYYSVAVNDASSNPLYYYHRLYSITVPSGGSIARNYSDDGLEMDESDLVGNWTTNLYNSRHQITGIKRANGLSTTFSYGSDGWLTKSIDIESHSTNSYTFTNGLLAAYTNPLGLSLNFSWDKLSRLTQIAFPDSTTISNRYDKLNLVDHKDRLNHWTHASYDSMRQLSKSIDANGHTNSYSFCFCGGLGSITDPLGNGTIYTRDNDGDIIQVMSSDGFSTYYHRDIIGQVTNITSDAGLNLKYLYNNQGLVTNVSNPAGTVFAALYDVSDFPVQITDARGVTTVNAFDPLGRLIYRWNAFGLIDQNYYNAQGIYQHYDALNHLTSYGYNPAGQLASVVDANGNTNSFTYNPLGQIATLTDGNSHVTSWAYDLYGHNIAKTDGNNVLISTNGYDAGGRMTKHWTPAKGLTSYSYDNNGNPLTVAYSAGTGITAGYDALNRITNMTDAVGSSAFTYANFGAFKGALATEDGPWSSDTITHAYAYRLPQSVTLAQPSGTWAQSYGYDTSLRLQTLTSTAGTFTYGYNGAGGQLGSLALPGTGNSIGYTYDDAGQLKSTTLQHSSTVLDAYSYGYDLNGSRTNVVRTDSAQVGYGYDNIGQLVSAVGYEFDGVTLRGNENFSYGYDAAGNLVSRMNNTLSQTFTPDNANELTSVSRNNGSLTLAGALTNTLTSLAINGQPAAIYNDLTFAVTNGVEINNGLNNFTTVVTSAGVTLTNYLTKLLPVTVNLRSDQNGNLVWDGVKAYEYDCANELTRITVTNGWKTEFAYDGFGRRRIRKEYNWSGSAWTQTNEVHYVYDGMTVIQERGSNNVPLVSYTRGLDLSGTMGGAGGIGGLLARTDTNGSAYYHADGNGNITAMMDSSGNQKAKYLYDSFGNTLGMWGTLATANAYRFSSKEMDAKSGLYYYGYRFYEPNLQRWLNQDPIGENGGINLYGYVGNNPINNVDPLGLSFWGDVGDAEYNFYSSIGHLFVRNTGDMTPNDGYNGYRAGTGTVTPITDENGNDITSDLLVQVATMPLMAVVGGPEGEASDIYRGSKLARNCEKAGKPVMKGVEAAHHIVAKAAKLAEPARQKLAQFGIDIHDAANGIGLAKDYHQGMHTGEYYDAINRAAGTWNTRQDAINGLNQIANQLKGQAP